MQVFPDLDRQALRKELAGSGRFVWIKRMISWDDKQKVNRLGIPGIDFVNERRRYYPAGRAAAHVLGLTNIDGRGIAGIEETFDAGLANGEPVTLSIDIRLQQLMREQLDRARRDFSAIGAAGTIFDVETGEVLAMVSLPDFDPNAPVIDPKDEARFNRITKGLYEMGSTFKVFTLAMGLDTGATTLRSGYNAARPLHVGRFTISDYHSQGRWLSTPEVLIHSSNIGAALMALDIGSARQKQYLQRFGLLEPDAHRAARGRSAPGSRSVARDQHDDDRLRPRPSVTPLNLVAGVGAVVNGGILRQPTLIRQQPEDVPPGMRVISPKTSRQMCELMRLVVEYGTGTKADVPGYDVGGKTGTADKSNNGRYMHNARIASFVGAFPMTSPRYVVLAMLDEPKGIKRTFNFATGGWVAAPVVGEIVRQMAPILGMPPPDAEAAAQAEATPKARAQRPSVRDAIARIQVKQFASN